MPIGIGAIGEFAIGEMASVLTPAPDAQIDPAFFEDYERARRKATRRERKRRDDLLAAERELRRIVEEAVRGPPLPAVEAAHAVLAEIEAPEPEITPQRVRAASRAILLALEEIKWQMGMEADDEAAMEALLLA